MQVLTVYLAFVVALFQAAEPTGAAAIMESLLYGFEMAPASRTAGLPADAERRMDPAYLVSLGAGAFPVLVERLPSLPPEDRELLRAWLRTAASRRAPAAEPWESFSLDRARARDALDGLAR